MQTLKMIVYWIVPVYGVEHLKMMTVAFVAVMIVHVLIVMEM
jgi:hypothetical protein